MSKVDLHTTVEEVIRCHDFPSVFAKKVNLGKIDLLTPLRSVFLSSEIPESIRKSILEQKSKDTLFEVNRIIYLEKQYASIQNALKENDDDKIRSALKITESMAKENIFSIFSFSTFPHKVFENYFEELIDAIHSFSKILFVPHVRYGKSAKTAKNYDAKTFCEYVDYAVALFNEKNDKSIFVPLDLDYPSDMRREILSHFAKNGYTNIWVDFKGKGFDNKNTIRKMRILWRSANEIFGDESKNLLIYQTNVRKLPRGVLGEDKMTPSDFLGVFDYGDFVGAPFKGILPPPDDSDYWKRRGYLSEEEYRRDLMKRDTSIFDSATYYYRPQDSIDIRELEKFKRLINKIENRRKAEFASNSVNGLITLNEITVLRSKIINEGEIVDYLRDKEFFTKEGSTLLDELLKSKEQKITKSKSLFEFLG